MNFGPKGQKVTVGLPGTGLSYSQMLRASNTNTPPDDTGRPPPKPAAGGTPKALVWLALIAILVIIIGAIAAHSPSYAANAGAWRGRCQAPRYIAR